MEMLQMRALTILATLIVSLPPAMAAQVTYYDLPEGAYPHDVAPAPDGSVSTCARQGFPRPL
jgi:streptogramin lyase